MKATSKIGLVAAGAIVVGLGVLTAMSNDEQKDAAREQIRTIVDSFGNIMDGISGIKARIAPEPGPSLEEQWEAVDAVRAGITF